VALENGRPRKRGSADYFPTWVREAARHDAWRCAQVTTGFAAKAPEARHGRSQRHRHGSEVAGALRARGQVEYVDWMDGYGRIVVVNHGGGYYTLYAHLLERSSWWTIDQPAASWAGRRFRLVGWRQAHFEVRSKPTRRPRPGSAVTGEDLTLHFPYNVRVRV